MRLLNCLELVTVGRCLRCQPIPDPPQFRSGENIGVAFGHVCLERPGGAERRILTALEGTVNSLDMTGFVLKSAFFVRKPESCSLAIRETASKRRSAEVSLESI
jgi:hypothetical protein